MLGMFYRNDSFNGDISDWDTSSVTNMNFMFSLAINFNRDISDWDMSSVTDMNGMFGNASVFDQDLSSWCVSNFSSEPSNFDSNTTAWDKIGRQPIWGTCP